MSRTDLETEGIALDLLDDIAHNRWDIAVWNHSGTVFGRVDPADRKRLIVEILKALERWE